MTLLELMVCSSMVGVSGILITTLHSLGGPWSGFAGFLLCAFPIAVWKRLYRKWPVLGEYTFIHAAWGLLFGLVVAVNIIRKSKGHQ